MDAVVKLEKLIELLWREDRIDVAAEHELTNLAWELRMCIRDAGEKLSKIRDIVN